MSERMEVGVEEALEIALQAHMDGHHATADKIYGQILAGEPNHPATLYYLGILRHQLGQTADGLALVERAIAANPLNPAFYNSCGEIYRAMGQLDEAEERVKIALRLKPDYPEAYENLAALAVSRGDMAEAESHLCKAVELAPEYAEGHNNLGTLYETRGRLDDALHCYEQALRLKPEFTEARHNLARLLASTGQIFEALARYEDEFETAVGNLEATLASSPDDALAHDRLGVALQIQDRLDEALQHHLQAVRLRPELVSLHINLGNVLQRLGRSDEAVAAYRQALSLNPGDVVAEVNLGNMLHTLGHLEQAASLFRQALDQFPDLPEARYNLSLVNLALGDYANAWHGYMLRHGETHAFLVDKPAEPLPMDLGGKTILLLPDQGFGDELFFLRFAPELARRGATLIYATATSMNPLASRLPFLSRVVRDATQIEADLKLSIGDLPYLVGMTRLDQLPPSLVLSVDPVALEKVRGRLAGVKGPLLGVSWRAGVARQEHPWRGKNRTLMKYAPSHELASAVNAWQGDVLILQRSPMTDELAAFKEGIDRPVHDFSDLNDDLEQMLALLSLLDGYVAVSNTNVHLRAALGRPTHVLVPRHVMDWRWSAIGGVRSPWFPDCPLYQQGAEGDWAPALAQLRSALAG